MAVKNRDSMETGPWAPVDFSNGAIRCWEFGRLCLWVRKRGDEWLTAAEYRDRMTGNPRFGEPAEAPEEAVWSRFVTGGETRLEMKPVLPDRPIILRPESPLQITRGAGTGLYLHVPVWLQANALTSGGSRTLAEYPSEQLSSSWFGDMKTGELCYAVTEKLRSRPLVPSEDPWYAVCPLTIKNASQTSLDFQRFCVRCVHLTLYTSRPGLFTNEIQVRFSGEDQVSQVVFSSRPPEAGEPLQVISRPRIPPNSSILKKSFSFFKSLTEM